MNYKFFAPCYARMCNERVDVNYWPFVKQKVTFEEQILMSDLMYECFQGLKTDKRVIFDIDKLLLMMRQAWFAYNKDQFK